MMKTFRNLKYVCLKYVSSKRVSRAIENTNTKTSQKHFFCKSIQNKSRTVSSFIAVKKGIKFDKCLHNFNKQLNEKYTKKSDKK